MRVYGLFLVIFSSVSHGFLFKYQRFDIGAISGKKLWSEKSEVSSSTEACNECKDPNGMIESPTFIVDPTTDPTDAELTNENFIKMLHMETSDQQCNLLGWKCLGYRLIDPATNTYDNSKVFPKWREKYPTPPDLIGVTRSYEPSIDKAVRDTTTALARSIPRDYKGGIRTLVEHGFRLYKVSELTPNKTRRATLVNFLIYYRDKIYGKTFEQIQAEREEEQRLAALATAEEQKKLMMANGELLPTEQHFQNYRLDENAPFPANPPKESG